MNINVSDKLIYLGAGCGIGVVLGLLFAPQSGEEMRHTLTDKMDDITHKVQDKISHSGISDTASRLGDTATQTWNSVIEKGKNVASIGRQRLNESLESGKRKYNESVESEDMGGGR